MTWPTFCVKLIKFKANDSHKTIHMLLIKYQEVFIQAWMQCMTHLISQKNYLTLKKVESKTLYLTWELRCSDEIMRRFRIKLYN